MTCFVIVLVDEAGGAAAVTGSATPSPGPSSQHEQQSSKSGASDGTAPAAFSRGAEDGGGSFRMSLKSVAQRMAASPSPSFPLAVLVLLGPLLLSYFIEG